MKHSTSIALVLAMFTLSASAQTDPVPSLLTQLAAPDLATRETGFYALLHLGEQVLPQPITGNVVGSEVAALLTAYPADRNSVVASLIGLLSVENSQLASELSGSGEDLGEFHADLVAAVVTCNDPRSLLGLMPY